MTMTFRNRLPHERRTWILVGTVVLAAIVLFLWMPSAAAAPCPHSQPGEEPVGSPPLHELQPDCCRGQPVLAPSCGRKSMAGGSTAAAAPDCTACFVLVEYAPARQRSGSLILPAASFHARSMRVLR